MKNSMSSLPLLFLLVSSTLLSHVAGASPSLVEMNSAATYAVLAGSGVSNSGFSVVTGDVGLSPGTSVAGFPPGIIDGELDVANTAAANAVADLHTAILDAQGRASDSSMPAELGGLTLVPGVYTVATNIEITNILYLDAQNDPDAAWIFQIGTSLNVNTGAQVIMTNAADGVSQVNVWWVCGSSATIGTNAKMIGAVMAEQSVSAAEGASTGPLLGYIGGATLLNNKVASYKSRTRCMTGYTGDVTPFPTECSFTSTATAADEDEAEDQCDLFGGSLVSADFTAGGVFTCVSDPIPYAQLHDRRVASKHNYEDGKTVKFIVALPDVDCYNVWFSSKSKTKSGDIVSVFQYRNDLTGSDRRTTLYPTLKNKRFQKYTTQEDAFVVDGDAVGVQLKADKEQSEFGFIAYISSCPE